MIDERSVNNLNKLLLKIKTMENENQEVVPEVTPEVTPEAPVNTEATENVETTEPAQ